MNNIKTLLLLAKLHTIAVDMYQFTNFDFVYPHRFDDDVDGGVSFGQDVADQMIELENLIESMLTEILGCRPELAWDRGESAVDYVANNLSVARANPPYEGQIL